MCVEPLDAERLWATLVHPDPSMYSVRRQLGHWTNKSVENWIGWHDAANDPSAPDDVASKLRDVAKWSDTDRVVFMHNRRTMYLTPWATFLTHWRKFLMMNNYPIVVKLLDPKFFYFGSTGNLAWGWRPIHESERGLDWIPA